MEYLYQLKLRGSIIGEKRVLFLQRTSMDIVIKQNCSKLIINPFLM